MEERRLNWRQACEILGCGKSHFYALINKGVLPAYRLKDGKKGWWVYEKDCFELVEQISKNTRSACLSKK